MVHRAEWSRRNSLLWHPGMLARRPRGRRKGATIWRMTPHVEGWDATHSNLWAVSADQGAGYTTGSPDVRWTDADWNAHKRAIRICQDDGATDDTADVLDVERFAATPAQAGDWYKRATATWMAGQRPGQRRPAIYTSFDNIGAVQKALTAAKVRGTPRIWVAHWGIGLGGAVAALDRNIGPYYPVGIQYQNAGRFDLDVWNQNWLDDVSVAVVSPPPPPVTDWTGDLMAELPTLKLGDRGPAVRTAQGLLVARYYSLGTTGAAGDGIDGDFGQLTNAAVREIQGKSGLKVTGVIDPQTWPVLAGV